MKTTLREKLKEYLEGTIYTIDDLIIYCPDNGLDVVFDDENYSSTRSPYFIAWSEGRVYILQWSDDGDVKITSAPRNP